MPTKQSSAASISFADAPDLAVAPFLRWAGGKRWLVPQILELVGETSINRYHEPFLGGASVFFGLAPKGEVSLSDLNGELMSVYEQVRDSPDEVAHLLGQYANTPEEYYFARASTPADAAASAARFIYLNHTSFNGIYRVNLKGEYNVPYGNRKHTNIPDLEWLRRASVRLEKAKLRAQSFETALESVTEGDLVFLDPPYTVAHNNNGFVKYNQHLFSFEDQKKLAKAIEAINAAGARYILTNAAHISISDLFSPLGTRITVSRKNSIGGSNAIRGRADEYLFTNLSVS